MSLSAVADSALVSSPSKVRPQGMAFIGQTAGRHVSCIDKLELADLLKLPVMIPQWHLQISGRKFYCISCVLVGFILDSDDLVGLAVESTLSSRQV